MSAETFGVFEHTPVLLFVADADGTLLRVSKRLSDRFGAPANLRDLVAPDEHASVEAFLAELARSDQLMTRKFRSVRLVASRAPDGNLHGQLEVSQEAEPVESPRIERELLRMLMSTLDVILWAIDRDGTIIFQDGKALANAGMSRGQLVGQNIFEIYPPEMLGPIRAAIAGRRTPEVNQEIHGIHWRVWTIPLESGGEGVDFVAGLSLDVSAEARSKAELERRLATIQEQQGAILELSAPIINVWDSVLTVPLIGALDNDRANELIERLLGAASRSATRYVILDLTGVDALDTSIAGHLLRLLRSLRLLGVEGLVTGISPQVAQTMVGLGVELEDVRTFRSLRESLRYCMRALHVEQSTAG